MTEEIGRYALQRYAIQSSGDPEQDQREIEAHVRQTMRIDEGLCPNHPEQAAELIEIEPGTWQCPQCKFVLQRRTLRMQ